MNFRRKQLEQDLELPNIKASLIVYCGTSQKDRWCIKFFVPGPDRRYTPGIAIVSCSRVPKLINDLKKAHIKMELLKNEKYMGKFSEEFILRGEVSNNLSVIVSSEKSYFLFWSHKTIRLEFLVSSETNTFIRSFDSYDVKTIIDILCSAEYLAADLIKQLQK